MSLLLTTLCIDYVKIDYTIKVTKIKGKDPLNGCLLENSNRPLETTACG
jgi:hypothetical protein